MSEKIPVSLKSDKIKGTLHEDRYFLVTYHSFLLRMRNVSYEVVEKIKTHILCSVTLFRKIVPFMR